MADVEAVCTAAGVSAAAGGTRARGPLVTVTTLTTSVITQTAATRSNDRRARR
jgi:hypothetical protein